MAAAAIAGVGIHFGLSSSKMGSRMHSSSSRSSGRSVIMAVSIEEKTKKNLTLTKSEEAFAAAKVKLPDSPFTILLLILHCLSLLQWATLSWKIMWGFGIVVIYFSFSLLFLAIVVGT